MLCTTCQNGTQEQAYSYRIQPDEWGDQRSYQNVYEQGEIERLSRTRHQEFRFEDAFD